MDSSKVQQESAYFTEHISIQSSLCPACLPTEVAEQAQSRFVSLVTRVERRARARVVLRLEDTIPVSVQS